MKRLIILFFAALLLSSKVEAQNYDRLSEYEQHLFGESVYVNGEYDTMKRVRAYWVKESNKLKNRNYEFVLCGNAEGVLKVTIPSRVLFAQDATELSSQAETVLRPFLHFIRGKEALATCIVVCHSDNNGSEEYLSRQTESRAATLDEWFQEQGVPAESLSHYGLSTKVPRTNNENIKNRELNRRVTLYFVPNKKMLKAAKKGKL